MIVRRVFEYATRIVRSFSAGGSSVIDPQDIANELIAAERTHKEIGQFSDNRGLQVGMRRLASGRPPMKEGHHGP